MSQAADGGRPGLMTWLIGHAKSIVGAFVLVALLAGVYAGLNLRIDTSTTEMIAADVPFRRNAIAFERAFPEFEKPLVALIGGESPELVEAAAARLVVRLRDHPELFKVVEYLPGEPFFARHGLLYMDVGELERLSERLAEAQPLLAVLAADPTLRGLADFLELAFGEQASGAGDDLRLDFLLREMAETASAVAAGRPATLSWRRALEAGADERKFELVLVQPRLDYTSLSPASQAIDALREAARAVGIRDEEGLSVRLTGEAVLQQEELQSVRGNALLAATITTVGVTILLIIGLGTWRLILPVLLTLAIGLVLTAALALFLIGRLNLISVTFAVLFIGLGVDFGIHLALRFREALVAVGAKADAIRTATWRIAGALSLSALTAAVGFLAFVPTDYQGLAELGLISAAGMAIALLTSLTLLPALLALIGPDQARQPRRGPSAPATSVTGRPRLVLTVAFVLAALSLIALPEVAFDFDPLNLKDPESESVRTFHVLADDPSTSPYVIDVLAEADEAGPLADRLRTLPEVGNVVALSSFVPADQEIKLEILESLAFFLGPALQPAEVKLEPEERVQAFERLESLLDQQADAAGATALSAALDQFSDGEHSDQRLEALERALIGTLPDLLDKLETALDASDVTLADLPQQLVERWRTEDGRLRLLVRPAEPIRSNDQLRAFADAVLQAEPSATGTPVVVREAGREVQNAFARASWIALAGITLILAVVLRRPVDVALVLIPLLLAVLYTAASAVLLGLKLNFANVIVLPLLLGLGVSGAIHMVLRARQTEGEMAVEGTSTPRAVLFSALTTIASFGSLAISAHLGLASMGQLLTIAILWSLVCTLIVLPNLLVLRERPARRR